MRAVVLVDGEHYPPVTRDAVAAVVAHGHDVVGAGFLGGAEKLTGEPILPGIELIVGVTMIATLRELLDRFRPEAVVDLSDAPVLGASDRMTLASIASHAGVIYEGRGFRFEPPRRPRLSSRHTVSVIGSGKRTGKTAVCAALAREARTRGKTPLIVAMGRGGPAEPVITRGAEDPPTIERLVALAADGQHASTDAYEDAIIARCTTVGARRGGAGLNGDPYVHTVHEAIVAAQDEPHEVLFLEGSGTAIPPAAADTTLLVIGSGTDDADLFGGLCDLRFEQTDALVLTGVDAPGYDASRRRDALSRRFDMLARPMPVLAETAFRLEPMTPIEGAKVVVATTAPEWVEPRIRERIEDLGATCIGITHALSDRARLREELARFGPVPDLLVTEVKAAGIDVAATFASGMGWGVVLCDNVPHAADDPSALVRIADALL